ncbi:unnamed protein product [Clonostachys rosea f. rosea IK726]|uniref:Uncharacterized protein n=2 Tax=Bionectria ochroleuca TaxID=29856 RepID=A0A0B7JXL2_BIOOC|nr:unnamed protein product [Clonostachys rosea f. rosea IK726]
MADTSIQRRTSLRTNLLRGFMQRLTLRGSDPDPDESTTREHVPSPMAAGFPVCFAVDVSGSTEGWVLGMEQEAIIAISTALGKTSQYSMGRSSILPWNDKAYGRLPLKDVKDLVSGGGTVPAAIFRDREYRSYLQQAGLWVLITDGQIDQFNVRDFSNSILEAGVHGTACVIIAFGYRGWSPFQCNVSVGISVFAVAPHCLFLYHAIHENKTYVIQAKGCFKQLLPDDKRFILFNESTRWDDLHSIGYDDLASVKVPRPAKLLRDSVLLPNGRIFDMRTIYQNRVSNDDTLELLSDPASLDVILLAANTRGTGYLIEAWLEKIRKKHRFAASRAFDREEVIDREDIGGVGLLQLTTLIVHATNGADEDNFWDVLRSQCVSQDPTLQDLKSSLCYRHQLNWNNFQLNINARYQLLSKIQKEVDGALSTISHIENGMSAPSPALLTPMSSLPRNVEQNATSLHSIRPGVEHEWSSLSCSVGPSHTDRLGPFSNEPSPMMVGTYDEPSPHVDISTITFLPEFKTRDVSGMSDYDMDHPPAYDTCLLCDRPGSIQTLLFHSRSTVQSTRGLPAPNSRSGHKFPLVLGNYAETDVTAPIVTCDGCAFLFQQVKQLPNGGGSVAACLPLVPLKLIENRSKWIEVLSEVYEHRFSQNITLLVFLSTLCSTLEDLSEYNDEGIKTVQGWFEWVCREIMSLPGLASLVGLTPAAGVLSGKVKPSMPLRDVLTMIFSSRGSNSSMIELPLLAYPIHGFIVIVRLARLVKEIEVSQIELLVWKRLCYHLIEQHAETQIRLGVEVADKSLDDFLFDSSALHSISLPDATRRARSVCQVVNLVDTHLLHQDTLDQFRRIDPFFRAVESSKSSFQYALVVVLHLLNDFVITESKITNPGFCFSRLQYQADKLTWGTAFKDVLESPNFITEEMGASLITQCISLGTTSKE